MVHNYIGHHVVLERHGDDIEADDPCDGKVKVLAARCGVQEHAEGRVVHEVGRLAHFWNRKLQNVFFYYLYL